jgi:hypothetical protein
VCEKVIDWLKQDGTLGASELQRRFPFKKPTKEILVQRKLQRRLKDAHKIEVSYMRV